MFICVFAAKSHCLLSIGVYKRALQGNASAENAKMMGKLAKLLATRALQVSQDKKGLMDLELGSPEHVSALASLGKDAQAVYWTLKRFLEQRVAPAETKIASEVLFFVMLPPVGLCRAFAWP